VQPDQVHADPELELESGRPELDPILGELATGTLELEINPKKK